MQASQSSSNKLETILEKLEKEGSYCNPLSVNPDLNLSAFNDNRSLQASVHDRSLESQFNSMEYESTKKLLQQQFDQDCLVQDLNAQAQGKYQGFLEILNDVKKVTITQHLRLDSLSQRLMQEQRSAYGQYSASLSSQSILQSRLLLNASALIDSHAANTMVSYKQTDENQNSLEQRLEEIQVKIHKTCNIAKHASGTQRQIETEAKQLQVDRSNLMFESKQLQALSVSIDQQNLAVQQKISEQLSKYDEAQGKAAKLRLIMRQNFIKHQKILFNEEKLDVRLRSEVDKQLTEYCAIKERHQALQ